MSENAPDQNTQDTTPTFAELGVDPQIVAALEADGKTRTFAIQELTLPLALAGNDLIGQARTGMGKTYGFGVPLLQRVTETGARLAWIAEGGAQVGLTVEGPDGEVLAHVCHASRKDLRDAVGAAVALGALHIDLDHACGRKLPNIRVSGRLVHKAMMGWQWLHFKYGIREPLVEPLAVERL